MIRLTAFLGRIVIMGYRTFAASKKHVHANRRPWYVIVIMGICAAAFFYFCFNYCVLLKTLSSAAKMPPFLIAGSMEGILVLAGLCRRCVGLPILVVVGALLESTFVSMLKAGRTVQQVLIRVISTLFLGRSGLLSTEVQVCAKFIAGFIIVGRFLERTAIASFLMGGANAIAGWSSGRPAKVGIISSALCGMVSGSSVCKHVTTRSVTIPMVTQSGYKADFAVAFESAASTRGQIMPPIMGAAAFRMAGYIGGTFGQVTLWEILPAVLYFRAMFISVHVEAKKLGRKGIPRSELRRAKYLIRTVYLLLPLVFLFCMLTAKIRWLLASAAIAILFSIAGSQVGTFCAASSEVRATQSGRVEGITATQSGRMILDSLVARGKGSITVAGGCAMEGMIAGFISVTGQASKLISGVIAIRREMPNPTLSLLLALLLPMLSCILLGMGVPTSANYFIIASTCAAILITLGIPTVAAHFFVFYLGILADITPPVALAAYAGSAIAKSDPMKTAINATKLAIPACILPYIFAMNTSMLLLDQSVLAAMQVIITSCLAMFAIAAALVGYIVTRGPRWQGILLAARGLCLMDADFMTDVVGVAVMVVVILLQMVLRKKIKPAAAYTKRNLSLGCRSEYLTCMFLRAARRPAQGFTHTGPRRIILPCEDSDRSDLRDTKNPVAGAGAGTGTVSGRLRPQREDRRVGPADGCGRQGGENHPLPVV